MRAAIIVTNYRRPQNPARIVAQCVLSQYRPDVIIVDNAIDDSLCDKIDMSSGLVDYRPNYKNLGAGHRFAVAAELEHAAVVAIDDDMFLSTGQIDRLFESFFLDPSRPHGLWGEKLVSRGGKPFMLNAIQRKEIEVDILNRVYAFNPAQAKRACLLVKETGFKDWLDVTPSDDVLLSFATSKRPIIHDFGVLETCETSGTPGIALWRTANFKERRWDAYRKLQRLNIRTDI